MSRAKTARYRKSKRHTMRKPRASLRVTNNNLNLNEDPNVKWNLISSWFERHEAKEDEEAQQLLKKVPKDTFYIMIDGESFAPGTMRPMRALDFLEYLDAKEVDQLTPFTPRIQVLYIGTSRADSYYCFLYYSPILTRDQREQTENYSRRVRGVWNVLFLPVADYFKYQHGFTTREPDQFFLSKYDTIRFLYSLPHLYEKAQKELSATKTAGPKFARLREQGLESAIEEFQKKTGQVFPENTEGVIKAYLK